MIKLEEHTVLIENKEYIPLDIAKAAVAEAYNTPRLDSALDELGKVMDNINNTINDSIKND
tara:strand:+ start:390 stop:572 length:183 start_codon:yes stop_codon:yes gene_type:complete